jgi:ADP-ribose pyrophosphatase YjhB (NUDIX family)
MNGTIFSFNMKTLLLKIWKALPNSEILRGSLVWLIMQKFLVGVVGVVLDNSGQILFLKHTYRKKYPWGLPGGWLKRGEQPMQALRREIREETGMDVEVIKPLIVSGDDQWPRVDLIFLCRVIDGAFSASEEVSSAKFFAIDQLPEIMPSQKTIIQQVIHQKFN